jgi:hypothetical protein
VVLSKILSYNFNVPKSPITNDGTATGFALTPVIDGSSGHPAKDRGIYFDSASNGYIIISGLFLNHTFAVHSWVLMKANTVVMTIFSKDRNVFTASDKNLLNLIVNASNKMEAKLATDTTPFAYGSKQGSSTLVVDTWYYLTYSFSMSGGKDTTVSLFKNNVDEGVSTTEMSAKFLIDGTNYEAIVGAERTATAPTFAATKWKGYIYDLHIYQVAHLTSNTLHAATCTTGCSTLDFAIFGSGGAETCTGTNCIDRSCVRAGVCQLATACEGGTFPFCHLCLDRECKICDDYGSC